MKYTFVFIGVILFFASCKRYVAATSAMEGTIKEGESFGYDAVKSATNGDIVVFNNKGISWVQRVIGKSGEIIKISNGEVSIDSSKVELPVNALVEYEIKSSNQLNLTTHPDYKIVSSIGNSSNEYIGFLTKQQLKSLRKNPAIHSISKVRYTDNKRQEFVIQEDSTNWNVDFFGPLKIPKIGDEVLITPKNFLVYQYLTDKPNGKLIIKENLYFLMGDNRHNSYDSRFLGFIPESLILDIVKGK